MGCGHPLILRILTMGIPINGFDGPFFWYENNPWFDGILRERKLQHQLPFPVEGVEVQARMGVNRKWQALNNYNVLAVCRGNVTLRIAVDKPHRAVAPCRVKRQWHTETAMSSELLPNYILEDCTTRTTANWITNIKQATTASKSRQGKTSRQRRHLSVGTTEGVVLGQQTYAQCAVTTSDSITSSGGKQSSWFKSNWQAGTYKWCTRCAGRQDTVMIQVQGKSWSHWQLRTLQKASDMSPSRASAAKQFHDTHHAIGVWVPAFRHHPSKH